MHNQSQLDYTAEQLTCAEQAWQSTTLNGKFTPVRDGKPLRKHEYVMEWLLSVYGQS